MPSTTTSMLDGVSAAVAVKAPCGVVFTTDNALSGLQGYDEDTRALCVGQADAVDNGIYVIASGQWQRALDADGNRDLVSGTRVIVRNDGADGIEYELVTANPIVIGETELEFELRYGSNFTISQTVAEALAGSIPVHTGYDPGDVRRYATIVGSGGADTFAVQAAINQAMAGGDAWYVPAGVVCSVDTTGSVVTPVGNALLIDETCLGYIDGEIRANRNCNAIAITADDVVILGGGKVKGWGTFYQSGADNAALIKNTGSRCCIHGLKLEDPPQYGIFYTSPTSVGGKISEITIFGGPTSQTATQHYGVEVEGTWRGINIHDVQVLPNAAGTGRCVQGVASGTNNGIPTGAALSSIYARQVWDHAIYWYGQNCTIGGIRAYSTGGSGVKAIGGNSLTNIASENCTGGGIDLCDFAGGSLTGFVINDYQGIGLSVQQLDSGADDKLTNFSITCGSIRGKASSPTTVRCGIRVLTTFDSVAYSHADMTIKNIEISNASLSDEDEGAVQIQIGAGKTLSRLDLQVKVNTSGWQGVQLMGEGNFKDCRIDDSFVLNPGTHTAATGSDTYAFVLAASTTMTNGSMSNNEARDDLGGAANMEIGFSNSGTMTGVKRVGNRSFGHTSSSGLDGLRTGAGAIQLDSPVVRIATTGADALTLADGYDGQELELIMTSDGGAGTLNATNEGNFATITFDDVGDSASMKFMSGKWYFRGGTATRA